MINESSMVEHCRLCSGSNIRKVFDAEVMRRYTVSYFKCYHCGLLFTEKPYWLEEVYEDPISIFDTGMVARNIDMSNRLLVILNIIFGDKYKYLDYAGGNGLLVRLLRDKGLDYYWHDIFSDNLFSREFEWNENDVPKSISVIECFEHFSNPKKSIDELFNISRNIIFSTQVLPEPVPPKSWWYYIFQRGGHVAFYEQKTFNYLAMKYSVNYYSLSGLHFFSEKKIPIHKEAICKYQRTTSLMAPFFIKYCQSKTWLDYKHIKDKSELNNGRKDKNIRENISQ